MHIYKVSEGLPANLLQEATAIYGQIAYTHFPLAYAALQNSKDFVTKAPAIFGLGASN